MQNKTLYDCIIIGAGISGISFAFYLKQMGQKVLLLEKESEVGGRIQSPVSTMNAYWCELGAHTCYNSYTHLLAMVDEAGCADMIRPLEKVSYKAYANTKIVGLASQVSKLSLAFNAIKFFGSKRESKTVRAYFEPIVGKKNYCHLCSKAFRAVICQKDADDYPAQLFMKSRKAKRKDLPRKFTFQSGIGSMLRGIVDKHKIEVQTSTAVTNIVKEEGQYTVTASDGSTYISKNIALATDPQTSSCLLTQIVPEASKQLATFGLDYPFSRYVHVPKEMVKHIAPLAGIIPISGNFLSVVSRDFVSDDVYRSFTFHFADKSMSDHEQMALICKVLAIDSSAIVDSSTAEHVLPALRIKDLATIAQLGATVYDQSVYLLGNYFYGLSLEDCVQRSFDQSQSYKNYL